MRLNKFQITSIIAAIVLVYLLSGIYNDRFTWWPFIAVALLYLFMLIAGSIFIRLNFYLVSGNKLPLSGNSNVIALTFDDGPAAYTGKILDILKEENVTATFFLIGKHAEANKMVTKRIQDEGHAIGNHSYAHGFNFDWQSSTAMQREIEQTNNIIHNITGTSTSCFRPPYGVTNPNLAKAVKRSGMQCVGWSLRSMDTIAKDEKRLMGKILSTVKSGDIILLHDSCAVTANMLPELIRELKRRQYEFIRTGSK